MKRLPIVLVFALLGVSAATAEKTVEGVFLDQNIQASYNPLGVQLVTRLFYRIPLIDKPGILWESTRIEIGVQNNLSPAYDFAGAFINIEPIAIFNLTLTAQAAGYYTALGFGLFPVGGYGAGYDSGALDSVTPLNRFGYLLSAAPTVKAAVGPILFLDTGTLTYFSAPTDTGYFYEIAGDTILADSDTELSNQAYLLTTILPGLLAGMNDSLLYVPGSGYLSHRICAAGVYSTDIGEHFSLYGALFAGTFLADRYYQYSLYLAGQVGITLRL
ncbi:hypothetical protein [Salinispira pacifica]